MRGRHTARATLCGTLLLVTGAAPAHDGNGAANALSAYRNGNCETARTSWERAAAEGDVEAAFQPGQLYQRGIGIETDLARSLSWYRLAAEDELADAQYQLGLMYELGLGVVSDPWEAEYWYEHATSQGLCPGELRRPGEFYQTSP